jgi:lipoprotein-releasing system ATP-binding protein
MTTAPNAVRLQGVSKSYRDASNNLVVIEKLSYEFPAGASVAIVGRSGVGKSTLLHILGGLDRPSEGAVYVGDTDITQLRDRELTEFRGRNIGFIFQFHHLLPEFTALENVAMPLIIRGQNKSDALREAQGLLERVGLAERCSHIPGQLSGGEQQRVAIARSLVTRPRIILADEPTGNLDIETATKVRDVLLEVQRESGTTLVLVTHSRELAGHMSCIAEMGKHGMLMAL